MKLKSTENTAEQIKQQFDTLIQLLPESKEEK